MNKKTNKELGQDLGVTSRQISKSRRRGWIWKNGKKVADDLSEEALKKIYKKNLGGLSDKQILQMGEEVLGFTNKINKSAKNIKNIEKTLESFNKLPTYKQAWVKEMFKNPRYIKFLNGDIESMTLAVSINMYFWQIRRKGSL